MGVMGGGCTQCKPSKPSIDLAARFVATTLGLQLLVMNISSLQRIGILCTMCWTWKFKDCQEQPEKGRHPFTINMKAGARWTIQKTTIEYPWAIPAGWWQEYDEYVPDNSEAGFKSIPTSWVFSTCLISCVSECGDAEAVTLYFFAFRPRSLPMNRRPASWDLSRASSSTQLTRHVRQDN